MLIKSLPARVKAPDDAPEGTFEAIVATYDTDSVGDRIVPGAFAKSLQEWTDRAAAGEPMPVVWSHQHDDPFAHIGEVVDAKETDDGLWVKGQIDMDNPTGRQSYKLIKGGRVRNWSFAYEVKNEPETDDAGANLLKELGVFEVGPTFIGVNRETHTQSVKALADLALKAGRVLSAKNEAELQSAVDAATSAVDRIKSVLSQVAGDTPPAETDDQEPKSQLEAPAKDEEPEGAKSEEPNPAGPDLDVLAIELETARRE